MKILHIDIETAPNRAHVWGLFKQNIGINQIEESGYTLCYSAKWHNEKELMFDSVHKSSNVDMLQGAWDLLNEADAVVHYNGTKFDIPTLNKEFLLAGLPPPDPYHQIDLLATARRRFRFTSNKLDYVAQILGLGKKTKHVGHDLWTACMAGDERAWKVMERYNKQDVVLLEKVYKKILPWIHNHPNHALYSIKADGRPVCTNCGSSRVIKKGLETTKTQTYQRYRCLSCKTPLRGRNTILPKERRSSVITHPKIQ